ncbi:MAG: hypothetical protein SFY68_04725 [Candidatus Sumerlaeia bacterium]|nr:hypothetical protein [Candidatus Sumerlaeia bacterium]
MNIAKGDILAQVAATNFLAQNFNTIAARYANVTDRFDVEDRRLPEDTAEIDFKDDNIRELAFWDFVEKKTAEQDTFQIGSNDWGAEGFNPVGDVRVYFSQSQVNNLNNFDERSVGDYTFSITAVANVGSVQRVVTNTYQHRLGAPTLFNFLMLGSSISDCSICHIQLHGDIGQVHPEDVFQPEWDFNNWNGGNGVSRIYGSLYTNGPLLREHIQGSDKFERHLVDPGKKGTYNGWIVDKEMRIWSKNGGQLATAWGNENPNLGLDDNPYRAIDPTFSPLPSTWPSVKDNMLGWFEPRALSKKASGDAELRVEPRDNTLAANFTPWGGGTVRRIGAVSSNLYEQAIDRVFSKTTALSYNTVGLHPWDDLDGDLIPNGFDADIDTGLETTSNPYPESERGSTDPNSLAYEMTDAAILNGNTSVHPITGKTIFNPGGNTLTWNATTQQFTRPSASTYQSRMLAVLNANPNALSDLYRRSGNNFFWDAELTGIATSMDNILTNNFASTPDDDPGTISGIFPNGDYDDEGNPEYPADDQRNLIIMGSRKNPINTKDQVVVRGDIVITGVVKSATDPDTGEKIHGSIVTHRNAFIPTDLVYFDQPASWDDPDINEGDQIGIVTGGNIIIGNYMQISFWDKDKGKRKSDPARPGNQDPTNYYNGIMPFIWGNMIDPNDEALYSWYWGRDGSKDTKFNHMINPVYVMDGAEGGFWDNGEWVVENAGNTVADRFKGTTAYKMQIGGGLEMTLADGSANPAFNPDRKHQNFYGNSFPSDPSMTNKATNKGADTYYKDYYISTPGLLPLGSNRIPALPSGKSPTATDDNYGNYVNSWFDSEDLKVLTQRPYTDTITNPDGTTSYLGRVGRENNTESRWIKRVQAVLYSDFGVIGGSIVRGTTTGNMLQFYGAVIGRDIQIMAAAQSAPNVTARYNNNIGALYYDKRLLQAANPLGFPFEETFNGGEMMTPSLPPLVGGSRDNWRPFRLTEDYFAFVDELESN